MLLAINEEILKEKRCAGVTEWEEKDILGRRNKRANLGGRKKHNHGGMRLWSARRDQQKVKLPGRQGWTVKELSEGLFYRGESEP